MGGKEGDNIKDPESILWFLVESDGILRKRIVLEFKN